MHKQQRKYDLAGSVGSGLLLRIFELVYELQRNKSSACKLYFNAEPEHDGHRGQLERDTSVAEWDNGDDADGWRQQCESCDDGVCNDCGGRRPRRNDDQSAELLDIKQHGLGFIQR